MITPTTLEESEVIPIADGCLWEETDSSTTRTKIFSLLLLMRVQGERTNTTFKTEKTIYQTVHELFQRLLILESFGIAVWKPPPAGSSFNLTVNVSDEIDTTSYSL